MQRAARRGTTAPERASHREAPRVCPAPRSRGRLHGAGGACAPGRPPGLLASRRPGGPSAVLPPSPARVLPAQCARLPTAGSVRLQRSRSIPCPEMPRSHMVRQDFQLQSVRFVRNPLRTLKGLMRITLGIQKLSVTGVLLFKGNLIFLKIFLGYHRDLNLWKNLNF